MERILKCSVLEKLFEDRNEELSYKIIKNSQEYNKAIKEMEDKLNGLIKYVPEEFHKQLENDIDDFLFDNISYLSNFWNSRFYKIGFMDGINVKKDIENELEELDNGKCIK